MNTNRLTHVHVYIIGLVLMIIVGAGMYFGMLKPINDQNSVLTTQIESQEQQTVDVNGVNVHWNEMSRAKEALQAAKDKRKEMQAQLDTEMASRALPPSQTLDLGDRSEQYVLNRSMPNWVLLPRRVVETMGRYVVTSQRKYGVKVAATFAAPAPSLDPRTVAGTDIVAWELGPMTATGDFNRVMAWAKGFNSAPLLCSVDGLKCSVANDKGEVTATCSLTVFVFPKATASTAPGGAAGGAVASMPGGGGNMPGGGGGNMPGANGP